MEKEKLLSIIVPVYNVEKYLKRCMDSILNQTYKELEIILVDDGSQDNSGHICDEYAALDRRVRVVHQSNRGLSGARNVGVSLATGEYIAFLDSDDWVDKNIYKKLIELIEMNTLDVAVCSITETDGVYTKYIGPKKKHLQHVIEGKDVFQCYFEGMVYIVAWNKVYRKEVVQGIVSPEPYQNEDNYVSGRYLFRAKRMMVLDEPLYYYWRNPNGIMASAKKRPLDLCICTQKLMDDILDDISDKHFIRQLNHKQAKGIYHFIRDNTIYYKVKAISNSLNQYMCKNLDLRRWICFKILLWRRHIDIY